jgi:Domain of unknown function (DUF4412)
MIRRRCISGLEAFPLILASLLGAGLLAVAAPTPDVYFEQTTITRTDGQAAGPGVSSRVWVSGRRLRLEGESANGPAFLLQLDAGRAYRLDPVRQVAIEIDVARLRNRSQMDSSAASDLMGDAAEGEVRAVPLATPRTIAGYRCRGYRLSTESLTLDVYLAREVPIGIDAFEGLTEWSGAGQAMAGFLAEMRKLPGFPLETRARVSVRGQALETVSTITKLLVGPYPRALFEPPAGWRVEREAPPLP